MAGEEYGDRRGGVKKYRHLCNENIEMAAKTYSHQPQHHLRKEDGVTSISHGIGEWRQLHRKAPVGGRRSRDE